jgi:hypothetical protein
MYLCPCFPHLLSDFGEVRCTRYEQGAVERLSFRKTGAAKNSHTVYTYTVQVKVKCTVVQALRLCAGRTAYRGSRGIALRFHDHGTRRGEGSASRPGRSLPPGETRYPMSRRLGGPQGRSGQVRKISPPPGFDPRTVQPIASHYTD